jgi:hypothetical protein
MDGYAVAEPRSERSATRKWTRRCASPAVPFTDALEREGLDVNDPEAVVGYRHSHIDWVMRKVRPPSLPSPPSPPPAPLSTRN